MSWAYRTFFRPALFNQDSEAIHNRTVKALGQVSGHPWLTGALGAFLSGPDLPVELFGLRFPNPVGLAAGMDKEAEALPAWRALGFGFAELGHSQRPDALRCSSRSRSPHHPTGGACSVTR